MKAIEATLIDFEAPETETITENQNWKHPPAVEEWLRSMCIGRTLNVCCGASKVGDVRVDIDPKAPGLTEVGDLFNLPYGPGEFDTVICDPPFEYFMPAVGRSRLFASSLANLPRRRLLLSTNLNILRLKRGIWDRRLFAVDTGGYFIRLYWVFDRKVRPL